MAVRIQRAVRIYLKRRKALKLKAVAQVSRLISQIWRSYCVYRKRADFRKSLNSYRDKIIKIQSTFRRFKARCHYKAQKMEARRLYKFSGLLSRLVVRNVLKKLNCEKLKRERWEKRVSVGFNLAIWDAH